jgi:hypothetical protein
MLWWSPKAWKPKSNSNCWRREGFCQAQGYLLGRPQPLSDLANSIRGKSPRHFLSVTQ